MSGFLLPFMDTISRENNSMLPMAAVIIGGVALLLGGYAAVALNRTNKAIEAHDAKLARVEAAESTANAAAAAADKAGKDVQALTRSTQDAINQIAGELGNQRGSITKLEEKASKAVAAKEAKKAGGAAASSVAGPDEYIVKAGDGGGKIAKAAGFTTKEIEAVNPGLDWTKLKPGQKLKLPAKK
ncbi:MAG: LysM peptidoglycan-binding domain-containing protein [Opitutaceae bacterium]|nr:LysM peptidoglycan-binding domain-containing protein [Opitutaceae bacterium]